jgi:AcrR family transcriptional regulator
MQRARQSHQKQERRAAILSKALGLIAGTPLQDITMAQVAAEVGLVKGTLYLYFATREELFLEVLRDQYHGWFWDLEAGLEVLPRKGRLKAAACLLTETTATRTAFRILLAALHDTLERNLQESTALAFRRELKSRSIAMGILLERSLSFLEKGQGVPLLLHIQALIIGWQALAQPGQREPLLPGADDQTNLALDFRAALRGGIEALLTGFRDINRRHRNGLHSIK